MAVYQVFERMDILHNIQYPVISLRCDRGEVFITFSDNGFPN